MRPGDGETWLTLRAELAVPTVWADPGHEVAFGQFELAAPESISALGFDELRIFRTRRRSSSRRSQ